LRLFFTLPKIQLVFRQEQRSVASMEKPWFRSLFSRPQPAQPESTQAKAGEEDADAQFCLGLKFANREGAARDYVQAAHWYLKAADQNHALAQFNLGIMYAGGQGVSRNDTEAEAWFGKSARQGDAGAQHHLGLSRYRASAQGLPRDTSESRIEAYKWFVLAAAQGYRDSDTARDTVALKMSHKDVAEANQRAAGFVLLIRKSQANR
jgi:TPR repeat protein